MWPPNDNLDDFRSSPERMGEPPSSVLLESSGETEVLKPLAVWEGYGKNGAPDTSLDGAQPGLSWFHRSLAVSSVVAGLALIVATGAYLGIYGPPVGSLEGMNNVAITSPDTAIDQQVVENQTSQEESDDSDSLLNTNSPSAFMAPEALPSVTKRRTVRPWRAFRAVSKPRVLFAANHSRRWHLLPRPQFIVSDFVPTTLVIYVENGAIKTRIEPQLTATYKRQPAGSP